MRKLQNKHMNIISSFAIIALSALIHASFQLSVSVLMLLGGHSIGAKQSHARLLRLTTSFIVGSGIMTMLLLSFTSLMIQDFFGFNTPEIVWSIACGLSVGVAISIWLFYYRNEKGTTIWVPRSIAAYLVERTKSTKSSGEAFGLGISSILGELLFIVAPISISALVIVQLSPMWQLLGLLIYVAISLLSLMIVWVLIGSGHTLGQIQKWRETNKYFLQFAAGAGLIILAFFVYVEAILGSSAGVV
jgi:hypothetical protein